ncbi:MAG: hypothetical protein KKB03_00550 [Nanoarchaeota archaeon]|nr:hypothetical protein [Nanoarchaeota archaeon]MBU1135354.1 hypothetical protein [Nanoarchaeota archaeon]MBU2519718.1 hypothetical protein [Nanoarchaeota archaeon]
MKCIICGLKGSSGNKCKLCGMRTKHSVNVKGFSFCCRRCVVYFENILRKANRSEIMSIVEKEVMI